jgi:hypothetical protein
MSYYQHEAILVTGYSHCFKTMEWLHKAAIKFGFEVSEILDSGFQGEKCNGYLTFMVGPDGHSRNNDGSYRLDGEQLQLSRVAFKLMLQQAVTHAPGSINFVHVRYGGDEPEKRAIYDDDHSALQRAERLNEVQNALCA